jgi:hypothetical protein
MGAQRDFRIGSKERPAIRDKLKRATGRNRGMGLEDKPAS